MANPAKGEVAFKVADAEYTLKFSTNAICEMEEAVSKGLNSILQNMERLSYVRALLWAALRAKHPDISLAATGEIIDRAGMKSTTDAVGKAIAIYLPKPPEGDVPNG